MRALISVPIRTMKPKLCIPMCNNGQYYVAVSIVWTSSKPINITKCRQQHHSKYHFCIFSGYSRYVCDWLNSTNCFMWQRNTLILWIMCVRLFDYRYVLNFISILVKDKISFSDEESRQINRNQIYAQYSIIIFEWNKPKEKWTTKKKKKTPQHLRANRKLYLDADYSFSPLSNFWNSPKDTKDTGKNVIWKWRTENHWKSWNNDDGTRQCKCYVILCDGHMIKWAHPQYLVFTE